MFTDTPYAGLPTDLELIKLRLVWVEPEERAAVLKLLLVQEKPIQLLPRALGNLDQNVRDGLPLTDGLRPWEEDTNLDVRVGNDARCVFWGTNEFLIPVEEVGFFVASGLGQLREGWSSVGDVRGMIRRLGVLFGGPLEPGGGNGELGVLKEMRGLKELRLVFCDYRWKGFGPNGLKNCLGDLLSVKLSNPSLTIRLQLRYIDRYIPEPGSPPFDVFDFKEEELKDITSWLIEPTEHEAALVEKSRRVVDVYKGPSPNHITILNESGWDPRLSSWVVEELMWRCAVKRWIEEERARAKVKGMGDVEMS